MADRRKNIILFSFDDSIPFYKYKTVFNEPLQIPNLDAFCARSTVFQSAYCQSSLCGPSRASFMSGRAPHDLGVFINSDNVFDKIAPQEMWSYRLKEANYYCSSGGKVHHLYRPLQPRHHKVLYSDERKSWRTDMTLPSGVAQKKYGGHRGGIGTTDPADDDLYYDHQSANSAIDFLDKYDGDAPFYREIGFYTPHGPHYTPSRYKELYNLKLFAKPEEWAGGFNEITHTANKYPPNMAGRSFRWWKTSVRNYFSSLSHGDYHFGRIIDALMASKHAENTIVIILSDHGFHLGSRDRFRKGTLWEQAAAVPFIIFDPSQLSPREVDDPVAMIDVGPTVLDYAGLPPLERCVGQSVRPLVEGKEVPRRVIPTLRRHDVSARVGDYRMLRYATGETEFFDVKNDYWQLKNLGSDHPDYAASYAALIETCKKYGFDPEADNPEL